MREWLHLAVYAWIVVTTGAFVVIHGYDILVRHYRRGVWPQPITVYILVLNACISLILGSSMLIFFTDLDVTAFRLSVLVGVAFSTTHGLRLLLRYRQQDPHAAE